MPKTDEKMTVDELIELLDCLTLLERNEAGDATADEVFALVDKVNWSAALAGARYLRDRLAAAEVVARKAELHGRISAYQDALTAIEFEGVTYTQITKAIAGQIKRLRAERDAIK